MTAAVGPEVYNALITCIGTAHMTNRQAGRQMHAHLLATLLSA
jgi:hypothetical protein